MKKGLFSTLLLATAFFSLKAETFFSGETGVCANFINTKAIGLEPALTLNGFFSGQLTVSNALSFRGEFSLRTADLFDKGFTEEADSVFRITELSGTYTKSFAGATHTFSLFTGNFESIGSQQFVRRHLGIQSYASPLTENYLGQNGNTVYPIYGIGGSYAFTFKSMPLSTGIAIVKNGDKITSDFRLATAFRYFSMDFAGGFYAPLHTTDANGDEVFLLINTVYLHAGIDALFGNNYEVFSLFIQNGFDDLDIKKKKLDFSEMHLLVEPRINLGAAKFYFTFFSIPNDTAKKMLYLDDTLGINLNMFSDNRHTEKRDYTVGLNLMFSFEGKHVNDLEDSDLVDAMNIKISPYTDIKIADGILKVMLQGSIIKFTDNKSDALKLNIGYKKEL